MELQQKALMGNTLLKFSCTAQICSTSSKPEARSWMVKMVHGNRPKLHQKLNWPMPTVEEAIHIWVLWSADTLKRSVSHNLFRKQNKQYAAAWDENSTVKWHRPRYLDVYPLALNIHSASSYIRIGGCTPKISYDGKAGEEYYPLERPPCQYTCTSHTDSLVVLSAR